MIPKQNFTLQYISMYEMSQVIDNIIQIYKVKENTFKH
jgi:hypothetical protein